MYRTHLSIALALLAAALVGLPSVTTARTPQNAGVQIRVYDSNHKDYHNWDDRENQSWNRYLKENRKRQHDFKKANKKEQSNYWNWRHSHPDDDERR